MVQLLKFTFWLTPILAVGAAASALLGASPGDIVVGVLCALAAIAFGMVAAGISPGQLTDPPQRNSNGKT
jgi:hypothetical protein